MKRSRRILLVTLAAAATLCALAVAFAAFVLFTAPGGRLALRIANGRDIPMRATAFDGTLASRFRLYNVTLRAGALEADIDTVTIEWRPRSLRVRRLQFTEIDVAGARVIVHEDADSPAAVPAAATDAGEGRWKMVTEHLQVRRATVTAPGGVQVRAVDVTASGGPDEYRADVAVAGDVGRVTDVHAFVRVAGNAEGATIDSLEVSVPDGHIRGDGTVRWAPDVAWDASLAGTIRDHPVSASGSMALRGPGIEASDLRVAWGSARATLSGSMAEVADVTLDATIPSLAEILPRAGGSASAKGRITGTPSWIQVNVTATGRGLRADGRDIPNLDAVIDAALAAENYVPYAADVRRADIRLAGGTLAVRGHAAWRDTLAWDVTLAADRFETSTLTPQRWDLRGPVSARATTSGRRTEDELEGRVVIESLAGTLRDRALSGGGTIDVRGDEADFSNLRFDWGDVHVAADGHWGKAVDLVVELNAPDLSIVHSDLAGSIVLAGTAKGARQRPAVDATIAADSLRVRGYFARRIAGDIAFDPKFVTPARVNMAAWGVTRNDDAPFDSVRVMVEGPRENHVAAVAVTRGDLAGAFTARGALADSVWTGRVDSLRVRHRMAGNWRMTGAAPLRATPSSVNVDSLVLVSNGARLVTRGAWARGDTTRLALDLHQFPLSTFEQHFLPDTRITGTLNGAAAVRIDPAGRISARADLVPGPGRVALSGKWLEYRGRVVARADDEGVAASVDLALTRGSERIATIDGDLAIPGLVVGRDSLGTQPIEGTLDVDCADIAPLLALLVPDLTRNAAGVLTARLKTRGTAGDFRIAGTLDLVKSRFDLMSGLRLRDVAVSLDSDGAGRLSIEGGATSGGGRMNLLAASAHADGQWISGTFSVRGERFLLMNSPEAQVYVSPVLEVIMADRKMNITGDVHVPFARIEASEVPSSAVAASRDVVFVQDTLATRVPIQVATKVRVALGDSVTFSGFRLDARLDGSLVVEDEIGRPTRGTGEIQIRDGIYRAYGSDLTVDPGRFVFGGGPIDNPGLDIRAYRGLGSRNVMTGSGEIVGVQLSGSLRRIEISVFSNPPMSESEIFSYLIFGRPLGEGSSGEQSALASAALMVGMQQSKPFTGGVGKQLALDEAYIESGQSLKEASFVVGKYLSPKLYVSYATGFFEQANTFRVRYALTDKWTVQAENGRASGSDLLYRFERGK